MLQAWSSSKKRAELPGMITQYDLAGRGRAISKDETGRPI